MYLLEIDRAHNRMHIMLTDHFDEPQAKALLKEIKQRLPELEQGFHVLCDLTTLEKFDRPARTCFSKVMDVCNASGIGKVVRIIPDPLDNFGLTILSHFHYGDGIPVLTCKTLKEALKHLK